MSLSSVAARPAEIVLPRGGDPKPASGKRTGPAVAGPRDSHTRRREGDVAYGEVVEGLFADVRKHAPLRTVSPALQRVLHERMRAAFAAGVTNETARPKIGLAVGVPAGIVTAAVLGTALGVYYEGGVKNREIKRLATDAQK